MKHKRQYSNKQLRALKSKCHNVIPVFGRPVELETLDYRPRTKFDPKPWVWGPGDGLRYSAFELTVEPQHAPDVSDGAWIDQRHELEDTDEFVRQFLPCAGVRATDLAEVA